MNSEAKTNAGKQTEKDTARQTQQKKPTAQQSSEKAKRGEPLSANTPQNRSPKQENL